MDELLFQIEWLKTYAFANKLTWEFQLSQTPVSDNFFIDIDETTRLGFTIEEARSIRYDINELCLTRHMSIAFQGDFPINLEFDFFLDKFDFDPNSQITSYRQKSKYEGIIVHFIQLIQ